MTYTYDALGRVQTATYPNGSVVTYTYDNADNRTHLTMTLPANHAPVAATDPAAGAYNVDAGATITIDVRANDSDPDQDPIAVTQVAPPAAGKGVSALTTAGAGITFTANSNASGADSFVYTISDGRSATAQATVNVNVVAPPPPPPPPPPPQISFSTTSVTLNEGNSGVTAFSYTITRSGDTSGTSGANWSVGGLGGSPASASDFQSGTLPSGALSFASGETTKTIVVNVQGDTTVEASEGFTVTLSGASGATLGTATATGTITNDDSPPNPSPVAYNDDGGSTMFETPQTVYPVENDTDDGGNAALTIKPGSVTGVGGGTIDSVGSRSVTFRPAPNNWGQGWFQYQVVDAQGAPSNAATMVITILENQPPVAVGDGPGPGFQTAYQTAVAVYPMQNDSDPEGQQLSLYDVFNWGGGTAYIDGTSVVFLPALGNYGTGWFQYRVHDGHGKISNIATVYVGISAP